MIQSFRPVHLFKDFTFATRCGIIDLSSVGLEEIVGNFVVLLALLQVSIVPVVTLEIRWIKVIWVVTRHFILFVRFPAL